MPHLALHPRTNWEAETLITLVEWRRGPELMVVDGARGSRGHKAGLWWCAG